MTGLRYQVLARLEGKVLLRGKLGHAAGVNLNLVGGRDNDLLGHVPDHLVHHEHYRHAVFLSQVERLNAEIEAFLRRGGRQRDDLVIAVGPPAGLHHVRLPRQGGQAGRGPATLHVHKHARRLGHHRQPDVLHHQREARPGSDREGLGPSPHRALNGDGRGHFIFHLDESTAHLRDSLGESFHDLGGRRDRISCGKSRTCG